EVRHVHVDGRVAPAGQTIPYKIAQSTGADGPLSRTTFAGGLQPVHERGVRAEDCLQLGLEARVVTAQALPSAFMRRLTSRASAIDSGESTSATVCHVAACASQPRGCTPYFLARTATVINVFWSPKPGSAETRRASSAPSSTSRQTAPASPAYSSAIT